MRKSLLCFSFMFAVFGILLTGCEDGDIIPILSDTYGIDITILSDPNANSAGAQFTPTTGTAYVKYAIGKETDRAAFLAGTFSAIRSNNGDESFTVTFDNLSADTEYTVFARAFDETDTGYAVASVQLTTFNDKFTVTTEYLTDISAGFKVSATSDYYKFTYALGQVSDKQAFLNGTFKGTVTKSEITDYVANYFDLEAGKDYVFYCLGFDRHNNPTILFEIPVTTYTAGDFPDVELITAIDIYYGTYTLKPNDLCGGIVGVVIPRNVYDSSIYGDAHWQGNVIGMFESWAELNYLGASSVTGGNLELNYLNTNLSLDYLLEVYVIIYDKNMNATGVKYFGDLSTPSYDESAGTAAVGITVSDITSLGATYTFSPNEHTLGFMYETVDADWFDALKETSEYYETYLHELLFSQGYYWQYANTSVTTIAVYTEVTGEPGKRYYAATCPMNANGPSGGWGNITLIEYTTLSE